MRGAASEQYGKKLEKLWKQQIISTKTPVMPEIKCTCSSLGCHKIAYKLHNKNSYGQLNHFKNGHLIVNL